jgi:hypothetical protein
MKEMAIWDLSCRDCRLTAKYGKLTASRDPSDPCMPRRQQSSRELSRIKPAASENQIPRVRRKTPSVGEVTDDSGKCSS